MTGIGRGSGGPPWSVDLLADLQAGALDPREAEQLWPQVNADPEAREILAALDATQADLHALANVPAPPMPAHFAARLDAAIAAESQARAQATPAPVVSLDAARKRRNQRLGIGIGIFAAAAAAVGITFAALPGDTGNGAPPVAQGPLNFPSDSIGPEQLQAAKGGTDYGPFSDTEKLVGCFQANGISPNAEPLGVKQVTVDGRAGTLFVFASRPPGTFRLLTVGQDCGPGNPSKIVNREGVR
ncbi:hypothetical protein LWC34_20060 [Kibdelosporangium philippinense]|uniref:Anti-sigma factor n=1 Tax=Kibdelosporangium philippinense TaxID=211113 RepID=A0ABS8ZF09_9PSEU|nr:hypothetical protein [Kibdelosporangium philippinense]MCE7005103.1 hypothetical protein [Kibdelosporangium philippinense]